MKCAGLNMSFQTLLVKSSFALVLLFFTVSSALANVSVQLKSSHEGWVNTGLNAAKGDEILVSTQGSLDIGLEAPMEGRQLIWIRFGNDGDVFQLTFNDEIVTANDDGALQVAFLNPPNVVLGNRQGKLNSSYKMLPETALDFTISAKKLNGSQLEQTTLAPNFAKAKTNARLVKCQLALITFGT